MKLSVKEAYGSYMRAALRAKLGRTVRDWTDGEVLETFAVIQPPEVSFPDWAQALNLPLETVDDHNASVIAGLEAAQAQPQEAERNG